MNAYLLVILAVLVSLNGQTAGASSRCQDLKNKAQALVQKADALFNLDITVTMITRPASGAAYTKLSLQDSNAAHQDAAGKETLQIPDPCLMEEKLPSDDFWALLIMHEFSHKIIDREMLTCVRAHLDLNGEAVPGLALDTSQINHTNIFVLAAKILNHFGYDNIKAATEMKDYFDEAMAAGQLDGDSYLALRGVENHLLSIGPTTSFNSGSDFLVGEYFDGLEIIAPMLELRYPNSSLITDIEKSAALHKGNCVLYKPELIRRSVENWRSLKAAE